MIIQKLTTITIAIAIFFMVNPSFAAKPERIVLQSTHNIKYKKKGLKEPSGLALSQGKKSLWTVSDDTTKIFKMDLEGKLLKKKTISDPALQGLEGIALGKEGATLWVVKEDSNAVVAVNIESKSLIAETAIASLHGYSDMVKKVPDHFDAGLGGNKGLEGIMVDPTTGHLFLLKESGLLMEVSMVEKRILGFNSLSFAKDYSGICFEEVSQRRVWIVSDDSEKLYLFSLQKAKVLDSFALKDKNGDRYSSAEGISYDPDKKDLYIVTDKGHKLRRYKVQY